MAQLDERQLDPAAALAPSTISPPREPHRQFALKHEDCFMVADGYGDIRGSGDGLFRDDTRLLSRFRLLLGGACRPSLLGASLSPGQHPVHRQSDQPAAGDPRRQADAAGRRASSSARACCGRTACMSGSRCPTIPAATMVMPMRLRIRRRFPRHVRGARHHRGRAGASPTTPIVGEAQCRLPL